ncbi:hypothetical protein TIFTF001_034695 [Ficus carica]|uniref:Uncharacterized protein n=1 Tax=Ficus carica TaxID=3494 RepID=A0AA88J8Y1_FICCA|nr:hypothetical protein TIFTF001_034695 [Ficus carica]
MSCSPKLGHVVLLPCGGRPWCLGMQALACQGTRLGGWLIQARSMRCLTHMWPVLVLTLGPRIADEDLDLVIRRLSPVRGQRPAQGLRIEEPMADRRGTKRPTDEDRRERLAKMANLGKGKGKVGTSAPPSQNVVPTVTRPALVPPVSTSVAAPTPTPASLTSRPPGFSRDERQRARPDARTSRTREDRPSQPPAPRSTRGESRLDQASLPHSQAQGQSSSAHRALVAKFEERLSVELAESSKRSDSVQAANDGVNKQIEALCIMLSR